MKFSPVLFATLLVSTSCSTDEPPSTLKVEQKDSKEPEEEVEGSQDEVYFTLNVASNFDSGPNRHFHIILYDADGHLLDFKPYYKGSEIQFKVQQGQAISEKIGVTQFQNWTTGTDNFYLVQSYQDVAKGSTWNLSGAPIFTSYFGEFDITVSGIPDWKLFSFYNKDGFGSTNASSIIYSGRPDMDTSRLVINNQRWSPNNDYILSILDKNAELRYIDIENVQSEDSLIFVAGDLKLYDSYLNVTIPEATRFAHSVSGFETSDHFEDSGWQISYSNDLGFDGSKEELTLGYLDRFTRYKTTLGLEEDDYIYNCEIFGEKPTSLTIPKRANFELLDGSVRGIRFDTDIPYLRQESVWSYGSDFYSPNSSVRWTLYAPNPTNTRIGKLPEEILQHYPELKPDKLSHQKTILFLRGDTQDKFLRKRFENEKIVSGYVEETMSFGKR